MSEPRNWTPRRNGAIYYCSPACGGNCKHAEFVAATRKAAKLAKSLGRGWQPRVHENLGWHWNVVSLCEHLHVHDDGRPGPSRFTVYVSVDKGPGGHWVGHGRTARKAIENGLGIVRAEWEQLDAILKATEAV